MFLWLVSLARFIYNNTTILPMHIGKLLLDGHLKTPFSYAKNTAILRYYMYCCIVYERVSTIMRCLAICCDVIRASAIFSALYIVTSSEVRASLSIVTSPELHASLHKPQHLRLSCWLQFIGFGNGNITVFCLGSYQQNSRKISVK